MSYEAGVSLFGFHLARQIASGEPPVPVLYRALTGRMCQWRRGISSPEVAQEDLVIGAGTALGHATRGLDFWYCDSALFLDGRLPTDPGMNCQTIQYGAHCSCYTAPSQVGREIVD
ncbi:UNVERIFIED_CONTAM: hypothetical protein FKN15_032008 [Acipenser sinensis]